MKLFVTVVFVVRLGFVVGKATGAPPSTCDDMSPKHNGIELENPPLYKFEFLGVATTSGQHVNERVNVRVNEPFTVIVNPKNRTHKFKGLSVRPLVIDNPTGYINMRVKMYDTRFVEKQCKSDEPLANKYITHTDKLPKSYFNATITLNAIPKDGFYFWATIVTNYTSYSRILSPKINVMEGIRAPSSSSTVCFSALLFSFVAAAIMILKEATN
ncbi:uncharacterized protein LOC141900154 [Tubulanus polymorphus]|uniref:uncharacterized protein LOC141900154 n=1 Tax=Tubulanus polymorphus TaxID=672921 RepID=UPI003DA53016